MRSLPLSSGSTFSSRIVCLQMMQVIKSNSGLRSSFIDLLCSVYPLWLLRLRLIRREAVRSDRRASRARRSAILFALNALDRRRHLSN